MKSIHFATAVATIALATVGVAPAVQAADLMVATEPPPVVPASPMNVYALLYGGVAFGGTVDWTGTQQVPSILTLSLNDPEQYDLDLGWAFGGAIGVATPVDGVSIEGDVFHTHRDSTDYEGDSLDTTSLMANLKFTAHLSNSFDVYAGAGLGGIMLSYDDYGYNYEGWGLGYQAMVGASANVTDNVAVFGELRFQDTFSPVDVGGGYTLQAPVVAALLGLKLSM